MIRLALSCPEIGPWSCSSRENTKPRAAVLSMALANATVPRPKSASFIFFGALWFWS